MTIWLTSDLHLGHENIISYTNRPFKDVPHMNNVLISNWNSVVRPDDTVFVLGDFAMGRIDENLPRAAELNGTKLLVAGNHDRCWSHHFKKVDMWRGIYEDAGFVILPEQVVIPTASGDVLLCHFPYDGDHTATDRYVEARPVDEGMTLLHGHNHAHTPNSISKNGTRMVNVGVDAHNYFPVTIEELLR